MPGHATRQLPRAVLSILVGAMLVATVGGPGQAQPGGGIPDPGARPTPEGQLPMPGGGLPITAPPTTPSAVMGPLAADIAAKELEINTITQQLQAIEPQLAPAGTAAQLAEQQLLTANENLAEAEQTFDELVGDSYQGAAALPPDLFIPELAGLSAHAPALPVDVPTGGEAAALAYVRAREEARVAQEQFDLATNQEQTLEEQAASLEDQLDRLQDDLDALHDENLEQLVQEQRQQEEQLQNNVDVSTEPVNGFAPHPRAVRAVRHALSQLGKPYVWGTEGPNTYDCSGLVLWSYTRSDVRASLPRVAADQYWATRNRTVATAAATAQQGLLPGDLVFFGRGSWQSVHHVGMYVGNGLMVHAPNSREVVKVSPIWWFEFFAATRVFPARPLPQTNDPGSPAPPQPGPEPTPPGSTRPPTTRPPTTRPPTTPPTDPSPTPTTPSPTPTPTTTVPNLDGMTATEAAAALEEAGLTPDTGAPVIDSSCTAGGVVSQAPAAGQVVDVGTTVTFRVCQAPETQDPPPEEEPSETPDETPDETPSETPTGDSTPTPGPN
jgi:cell wall-associated NlpC family hydrolase